MHPKLNKCLRCRKPMHLIPMQYGKLHTHGFRAQCTECGFGHNMRGLAYSAAVRQYNKLKPNKRKLHIDKITIAAMICFLVSAVVFCIMMFPHTPTANMVLLGALQLSLSAGCILMLIRPQR